MRSAAFAFLAGATLSTDSVVLVDPASGAPTPKDSQWGSVVGGFFGPGAAEVAGALALSTKEGQGRRVLTGAFGLKRR